MLDANIPIVQNADLTRPALNWPATLFHGILFVLKVILQQLSSNIKFLPIFSNKSSIDSILVLEFCKFSTAVLKSVSDANGYPNLRILRAHFDISPIEFIITCCKDLNIVVKTLKQ